MFRDPRVGNRRQKQTREQLLKQLMQKQRKGNSFGKQFGAPGRASVQGRYGGTTVRGRPLPSMVGLLNRAHGRGIGLERQQQFQHASPFISVTQNPIPVEGGNPNGGPVGGPGGPGGPVGLSQPGGTDLLGNPVPDWTGSGGESGSPENPATPGFEGALPTWAPSRPETPWQQTPSAPISIAGLVPLGGGMYFNPSTGQIHGGPGSSGF